MSQLVISALGDPARTAALVKDPDLTLRPGDLLVAMEAAPINPVDSLYANGWYPIQPVLPAVLGSEGVGRVVEAGNDTDATLVGKRVVVINPYRQGVWGDRVVVPAANVVEVPEGADGHQLSMLSINPLTAHLLLNDYATLQPGDWVAQDLGNSGVGRSVIALARRAGVRTLNIVRRPEVAAELRDLGADEVLVDGPGLAERITEKPGLAFDGAGGPVAETLAAALAPGGTLVSYSAIATGESPRLPLGPLVFGGLTHRGLWISNWLAATPRAEIERVYAELAALVADGTLHVPVEATYPLDQYERALDHAARPGRSGKILFTFES
ncbi:zinc-dependent alcohol dehydrogenase family protein [Actinoplanes sp. NPDC051513]|uniref:zinc-dependent alcohol dehydrogenase family protein n=1 Tax=Actinoplanes sp. NPDC051513 TaxID=3363908 RepID=UPI0037AEC6D9